MSDAIRFLRDRIEKSLPLYQGDVDSALSQAVREDRAGRAVQDDGLDVERLQRAYRAAIDENGPLDWDTDEVAAARIVRAYLRATSPLNASGDER